MRRITLAALSLGLLTFAAGAAQAQTITTAKLDSTAAGIARTAQQTDSTEVKTDLVDYRRGRGWNRGGYRYGYRPRGYGYSSFGYRSPRYYGYRYPSYSYGYRYPSYSYGYRPYYGGYRSPYYGGYRYGTGYRGGVYIGRGGVSIGF